MSSVKEIDVVGAVIVRDERVLCVQRGPGGALAGKWEFPGGKVEQGEDEATALGREIEEELLCRVRVGGKVTTTSHAYDFGTIRLTTYYCELVDGAPVITEHAQMIWLPSHRLSALDWAPADIPAVFEVARHLGPGGAGSNDYDVLG